MRGEEMVEGGEQLVSTGIPVEALGRISLDEMDSGERSFSEPQESSEEELGMAFSPGKMVDDIVGADNQSKPTDMELDKEEIIFSGRATRKQLCASILEYANDSRSNPVVPPNIPSPILLPPTHMTHPSPIPSPITAAALEQSQPKTVADLMLHAFPKTFSSPTHSPMTLSPHLQTVTAHAVQEDQYTSLRSSPRIGLHAYEDTRRREGSPVGVIGQGRGSPRRAAEGGTATGNGNASPRWSGGFAGL